MASALAIACKERPPPARLELPLAIPSSANPDSAGARSTPRPDRSRERRAFAARCSCPKRKPLVPYRRSYARRRPYRWPHRRGRTIWFREGGFRAVRLNMRVTPRDGAPRKPRNSGRNRRGDGAPMLSTARYSPPLGRFMLRFFHRDPAHLPRLSGGVARLPADPAAVSGRSIPLDASPVSANIATPTTTERRNSAGTRPRRHGHVSAEREGRRNVTAESVGDPQL